MCALDEKNFDYRLRSLNTDLQVGRVNPMAPTKNSFRFQFQMILQESSIGSA